MPILEILKQTLFALWQTKLRSFLTMFGIVWGIASVILLVGLGIGFGHDQHEKMKNLGADIAIVWGRQTGAQAGGYAAGRHVRLEIGDAIAIRQQAALVRNVSPEIQRSVSEVSRYNAADRYVRGVWPDYQSFRTLRVSNGRLMTDEDEQSGARVALLGAEAKAQLFRGNNAIGETLMIEGYPYIVIGVLEAKKQNGSYGNGRDDTQLFVPYSSMARDFPPPAGPDIVRGGLNDIVVEPVSADRHEAAIKEVYKILGERHHFDPADKEALWIWDTLDGAQFVDRIFSVMTLFFGAVALLTLALGGVGVMNIMLVAVTERTREIGLMKALGARRKDILSRFLLENLTLTFLAGLAGMVIALVVAQLIPPMPLYSDLYKTANHQGDIIPQPSMVIMLISFAILAFVGIISGLLPAVRAARLDPIEALRHE